jgi:hypothetical protein
MDSHHKHCQLAHEEVPDGQVISKGRVGNPDKEISKAKKQIRGQALPLAMKVIIGALAGERMPEARIRAALALVKLLDIQKPDMRAEKSIKVSFGDISTTDHMADDGPAQQGEDESPLRG